MTTQLEQAARLALEALEANLGNWAAKTKAITALRAALTDAALERKAENARELGLDYEQPCPYVVSTREGTHHYSLSQREPLMNEEIDTLLLKHGVMNQWPTQKQVRAFARAIEAAHGIKGEA